MKSFPFVHVACLVGAILLSLPPSVTSQELKPLFYESFDTGKEQGVVGKAGTFRGVDARGIVDLDRGTMAFFTRADKLVISEWDQFGGVRGRRSEGYWGMILGFDRRLEDFAFNFYDVGRYGPPLKFQPCLGRWKEGEWHHLAATWDRNEGMTVYEDGKKITSNWGEFVREWNFQADKLFVNGVADELYVFNEPLTDAQIAQLAKGEKPTGAPIAITPADKRRANDLARYGWSGDSLAAMPVVEAGKPQTFAFARFINCVDTHRPVPEVFWGFPGSTWPLDKYGASIRGARMDITLAPGQGYDRVRAFVQRRFEGEFLRTVNNKEEPVLPFQTEQVGVWHRKLNASLSDEHLILKRKVGALGQLDFYRVDPLKGKPSAKDLVSFSFAKTETFPDTELGKALKIEAPTRFWNPVLATKTTSESWTLDTPAFGGFQAATEPPDDAKAFDGALVTLVAEGLTQPTPVRITIKEPIHSVRDWLVADAVLQPKGTGKQTFTLQVKGRPVINMPPVQVAEKNKTNDVAGTAFGVLVTAANPVKWHMGKGGSTVEFCITDMKKALPAAADDQEEFMREAYAEVMEGHAYADPLIVYSTKWLAKFAPERRKFRQLYERAGSPQWFVGINVPKLVYEEPKNTTGAPEWAFWQVQAMKDHWRILHWYTDYMQLWNGELGGIWNDDTDHVENWYDHALCMDDDDKIKNALRKITDGLWTHQLEEGVGKYVQDACHFYEEGMGNMGMRMVVDYGDPIVFARALITSSHYEQWLRKKPDGKYEWIAENMSINGVWSAREFGTNPGYGGHKWDIMVPAGYLIWYNRFPTVAKYYAGLASSHPGFHSSAIDRVTDFAAAKKAYAAEVVKPLAGKDPKQLLTYIDELGLTDEIRKLHTTEFKVPGPIAHYWGARNTDDHYFNWKMSGDTRWLVESYKRVCEWFYSHDWLNSEAMPSMDRNPLPRYSLVRARMGSIGTNRGASGLTWPLYGISYVKGGNDIAALVTENDDTKLSARFYPFTDKPHAVQARVWRLNGTYKVVLSNDKNDDGQPEEAIWTKEMKIDRGAFVDFTLPPKQCSILSFTPIKTEEPNYDKPDPAISLASCDYVYTEHLVVHVYNNGTKPVENLVVRVRDGKSGRVVISGEQVIPRIDAPLDMKPKQKGVEFKNINANTYGSIIIEVDPDGKIDDLNRYNNRVELKY